MLAIFNAGIYLPVHAEALHLPAFRAVYEVNLFGVVNGMVPVVAAMQKRNRGHIVLIGSVTAYFGWPSTGAYGATKAALNIMAEALRFDFDKMNIRIQVMNPGFVDTPLAARNQFLMPALMPVDKASARIAPRHPLRRLRDHLPAPPHLGPEADAALAARPGLCLHQRRHPLEGAAADARPPARSRPAARPCKAPQDQVGQGLTGSGMPSPS